jgi:hypothetical protein
MKQHFCIGRFERENGDVYRIVQIGDLDEPWEKADVGFIRIKPWSFEWLKFKLRKWRFFL